MLRHLCAGRRRDARAQQTDPRDVLEAERQLQLQQGPLSEHREDSTCATRSAGIAAAALSLLKEFFETRLCCSCSCSSLAPINLTSERVVRKLSPKLHESRGLGRRQKNNRWEFGLRLPQGDLRALASGKLSARVC
jgi:hypothetical protein